MYLKSDTLLLADVVENFRNMCISIYELDSANVLSAPWLAWQAALKKTEVKLELLTDIDMLSMVEKGIRGEIRHAIHNYAKSVNKYLNGYDKSKEWKYLKYWDVNNLYDWAMSQKLPVNNFEWIEETSQFNKDFIKKTGENVKLSYMDTDSFIFHVKTDDIYKDIAEDVEKRFDTSNYEIDRPLPKGKNEVIGLMKDELGGEIMKKIVGLTTKT